MNTYVQQLKQEQQRILDYYEDYKCKYGESKALDKWKEEAIADITAQIKSHLCLDVAHQRK